MTPLELFSKFYTDDVWDLLVTEINRYARTTYQLVVMLGSGRI